MYNHWCCFCIDAVLFENRYISADVPKTDQVKSAFAMKSEEILPAGLSLHVLPGAFNCFSWQVPGRTFGTALGSVRFFFHEYPRHAGFHRECGSVRTRVCYLIRSPLRGKNAFSFPSVYSFALSSVNRNHSISSDFVFAIIFPARRFVFHQLSSALFLIS